jgi:hypothetical protein
MLLGIVGEGAGSELLGLGISLWVAWDVIH